MYGLLASTEASDFPTRIAHRLNNLLERASQHVASKPAGQQLFNHGDHLLWAIEESILWTLDNTGTIKRPLPWLPFFPMLASIRVVGVGANLASWLLGRRKTPAEKVVDYIQHRRRAIRARILSGTNQNLNENQNKNISLKMRIMENVLLWWPIDVINYMSRFLRLQSSTELRINLAQEDFKERKTRVPTADTANEISEGNLWSLTNEISSTILEQFEEYNENENCQNSTECGADSNNGVRNKAILEQKLNYGDMLLETEMELTRQFIEEHIKAQIFTEIESDDSSTLRSEDDTYEQSSMSDELFYSPDSSEYTTPEPPCAENVPDMSSDFSPVGNHQEPTDPKPLNELINHSHK